MWRIGFMMALIVSIALAPAAQATSLQASDPVTVNALAVAQTPDGLTGVTATVSATAIADGQGRVFVQTRPLAETDMQGSARLAARVAADLLGLDWQDYDFLMAFRSQSPVIGGPSAGGVMALAATAALWNLEHPDDPWTVDPGFAATGTVNPDGTIGPVGGVPAKAAGAAEAGLDTVFYPAGQERFTAGPGTTQTMTEHCRGLEITCRSAASVAALVEAATGHRIERPDVEIPDTAAFQTELGASVEVQVQELEAAWTQARQRAEDAELEGAPAEAVASAMEEASARLQDARQDLDAQRFYLAATQSFRGAIQARYAQALMDLYQAPPERSVVQGHIDACSDAVASLGLDDDVADWLALQAIGAAQDRIAAATSLRDEAQARLDQAFTIDGWHAALFSASFCIERAGTVSWWAGLAQRFPAGAPLDDPDAVVQDAFDRAHEMVAYAQAVLGATGQAAARLQEASTFREAGQWPAALLAAAEAEALASVEIQTGTGAEAPEVVLDEARSGAARAVASTRRAGTEPIVSVSLVELSSQQGPQDALRSLWTARAIALLPATASGTPEVVAVAPDPGFGTGPRAEVGAALLAGILLGAGAVATAWVVSRR